MEDLNCIIACCVMGLTAYCAGRTKSVYQGFLLALVILEYGIYLSTL